MVAACGSGALIFLAIIAAYWAIGWRWIDAAFFPDRCLSAACAQWVVRSGVEFVGAFYDRLGFPDPLAARKARLASDGPRLSPA